MAVESGEHARSLAVYLMITSFLLTITVLYFYYYIGELEYFAGLLAFLTPAMTANGSAVLAKKVKGRLRGGDAPLTPIDGGRMWRGKRILGSNKTWEGLFLGSLVGTLAGMFLAVIAWLGIGWRYSLLLAASAPYSSLAALVGDVVSSFYKRRRGLRPGEPLPVCDQLDFYMFAVIVLWLLGVPMTLADVLLAALLVYGLHILTNCLAWEAGLKNVCP